MKLRIWWVLVIIIGQIAPSHAQSCAESRLTAGGQAQVVGSPNRVRDAASTNGTRIGDIPAGQPFSVLEIGDCENDIRWVRVNFNGLEGWTAEAVGGEYYLTPVEGASQVGAYDVVTLPQPLSGRFSSDGRWLVGSQGTALNVYDTENLAAPPRRLGDGGRLTFSPTQPNVLAVTRGVERVEVFDLSTGAVLYRATGPAKPVYGNEAYVDLIEGPPFFTPDGRLIYQSMNGHHVVDTGSWQEIALIPYPSGTVRTSYTLSPDLRWLVQLTYQMYPQGADDVRPTLYDLASGTSVMLDRGGAVSYMSDAYITPDSRYVILTNSDGSAQTWNLTTPDLQRRDYTLSNQHEALALLNPPLTERLTTRFGSTPLNVFDRSTLIELVDASGVRGSLTLRGVQNVTTAFTSDLQRLRLLVDQQYVVTIDVADILAAPIEVDIAALTGTQQAFTPQTFARLNVSCGLPPSASRSALLTPASGALRMRQYPSTSADIVGALAEDESAYIASRYAVCNEGYTWRYVYNNDSPSNGWIAEADATEYLVNVEEEYRSGPAEVLSVTSMAWAGDRVLIRLSDVGILIVSADVDDLNAVDVLWTNSSPYVHAFQDPRDAAVAMLQADSTGYFFNGDTGTFNSRFSFKGFSDSSVYLGAVTAEAVFVYFNNNYWRIDRSTGQPHSIYTRSILPDINIDPLDSSGKIQRAFSAARGLVGFYTNRGDTDGYIGLYDVTNATWTTLATSRDVGNTSRLAFSTTGLYLLTDQAIWNIDTGEKLRTLERGTVAFNADDTLMYEAGRIVEPASGDTIAALTNPDFIVAASFHLEGHRFAVTRRTAAGILIDIYDTATWELLNTIDLTTLDG